MPRARNIKPGFFKNEDLAECTPWARLCFAGLWTMADREGRLEDRPKRIKGELFPYDSVEVPPLLEELEHWGFIRRYQVGGERFILIVKFVEHQAPHGTEKDGSIPDENGFVRIHERAKNGYITGKFRLEAHALTVKAPDQTGTLVPPDNKALTVKDPAAEGGQNALIPDSGFLIPDSLIPDSGSLNSVVASKRATRKAPTSFEVTQAMRDWAKAKAPRVDLELETEKFRDHTFKNPITDWPGAWRNWMRNCVPAAAPPPPRGQPAEPDWRREQRERIQRAAPYAVGQARKPINPVDEVTDVLPFSKPIA